MYRLETPAQGFNGTQNARWDWAWGEPTQRGKQHGDVMRTVAVEGLWGMRQSSGKRYFKSVCCWLPFTLSINKRQSIAWSTWSPGFGWNVDILSRRETPDGCDQVRCWPLCSWVPSVKKISGILIFFFGTRTFVPLPPQSNLGESTQKSQESIDFGVPSLVIQRGTW